MGKVIVQGNCTRSLELTIRTSGIWKTQNPSKKMGRKKFSGILRYKRITESQPDHQFPVTIDKKKRIYRIVDFAVPADHWVKLKENEKRDKYLDLPRDLKKLWNMKMTVIPIVIRSLRTVTKGFIKRTWKLEDEWSPSKLEHCWDRSKYYESWILEETYCHSDSSENLLLRLVWTTLCWVKIIIVYAQTRIRPRKWDS